MALALAFFLCHRVLLAVEKRRFAPPGRLVDVGGYRLHLHELGEGRPTVVLDSALAGTSLSWFDVAPRVAELTRVVTYDRGGFGWSDPSPRPRRVDHLVSELDQALIASDEKPPFVLVGHSYGGWLALRFAASHLDKVAGMVLVDVPHPREWIQPSETGRRRIERASRLLRRAAFFSHLGVTRVLFRLSARGVVLGETPSAEESRIASLLGKVPESLRPTIRSFWVKPSTLLALSSLIENAPESASMVGEAPLSLQDRPLVLLTASNPTPERLRDQEAMAGMSSRSRHVVASRSGHWIPLDEPDLVVEAIRHVLLVLSGGKFS